MSLFSSILEKLGVGGGSPAARNAPTPSSAPRPSSAGPAAGTGAGGRPTPSANTPPAASPEPTQDSHGAVDISAILEKRAAANSQKLNWRTSIVDLLKLLELDSSLDSRKQLATELGCPPELMNDSAKMNVWLHKAVLTRVAASGGTVPKELLH